MERFSGAYLANKDEQTITNINAHSRGSSYEVIENKLADCYWSTHAEGITTAICNPDSCKDSDVSQSPKERNFLSIQGEEPNVWESLKLCFHFPYLKFSNQNQLDNEANEVTH